MTDAKTLEAFKKDVEYMLKKANITGWSFARISESEIWGLFPDSTFEEVINVSFR